MIIFTDGGTPWTSDQFVVNTYINIYTYIYIKCSYGLLFLQLHLQKPHKAFENNCQDLSLLMSGFHLEWIDCIALPNPQLFSVKPKIWTFYKRHTVQCRHTCRASWRKRYRFRKQNVRSNTSKNLCCCVLCICTYACVCPHFSLASISCTRKIGTRAYPKNICSWQTQLVANVRNWSQFYLYMANDALGECTICEKNVKLLCCNREVPICNHNPETGCRYREHGRSFHVLTLLFINSMLFDTIQPVQFSNNRIRKWCC
jgi:hypothetical protein